MINKERYINNVPNEMREYNQWLWFKKIKTIGKNEKEKIIKIPISPITGNSKDWNNKKNWASFETAVNSYESSGVDGLSFILTSEDPGSMSIKWTQKV